MIYAIRKIKFCQVSQLKKNEKNRVRYQPAIFSIEKTDMILFQIEKI